MLIIRDNDSAFKRPVLLGLHTIMLSQDDRILSVIAPSSESASIPQSRPIDPEQERGRQAKTHGNESQESVAPAIIQRLVHCRSEEGKSEGRERSQHRRRTNRRCSECNIGIDQVGLDALKTNDNTGGEDCCPDVWDDPVRCVLC